MIEKDILSTLEEPERLIANDYYFRYIFKKTEKIVCAVFYILSELRTKGQTSTLIDELEKDTLEALAFVGETLALRTEGIEEAMRTLVLKLTLLESKLRVLSAARHLPRAHLDVFVAEIDATIRSIRGLREERKQWARKSAFVPTAPRPEGPRTSGVSSGGTVPTDARPDRRSRILAVLRAQPMSSIKDISDTIKDCSEKTIQRELNDMIRDAIVVRYGEKRWSTYSSAS